MANYDSQKVPDLKALLTERGLPTTGKKSDLIERLTKDDEKKTGAAPESSKIHPEDEIDWDDEDETSAKASPEKKETKTAAATSEPDAAAKAGGTGQPSNPQAVPNQIADIDPSTTDDLSVKPSTEAKEGSAEPNPEEEKKEPINYAKGIAGTNIEDEIEKRKKRAERFGITVKEDEAKLLERAKKFGTTGPPKGLDEALPEQRERRKRDREDNDDSGRNKRRGGGRAGGRQGRGNGGDRRRDTRDSRREDKGAVNGGGSKWQYDATEKKKFQERKERFAAKPAS